MANLLRSQRGVVLLEALIGILIFSLGILALVALQSVSIVASAEAQYRVEAVNFANQMLGQIWTNVNRTSPTALSTSLTGFSHNAGGDGCAAGGTSGNVLIADWIARTNAVLPGATQQIVVNTAANNEVRITVCWQAPTDPPGTQPHRHVLVAKVN